ncbi:MAG: CrcB family protein [Gammaproteobacteria bacterium]|jgi:CrcB protein|nr:hypothetical protein [Gammaproteobacteria bacterium]MDP6147354.1 CrcB family protein [Gammaproteobacteria bacterium]HJL79853.1 CrcB family protein [Gammaproteobacteria bacterium]HJM08457.1 CrcB family protein [Gammaproteobacteria bacterium]|tara:strand:- start:3427 stop:3810 length:384 start_codon:yes stop_codon:yes gene_type:complete
MSQILKTSLIIGFGGFLGTLFRYAVTSLIDKSSTVSFPLGTVIVNLIGCFMIGLVSGYFSQKVGDQTQLFFFLTIGCLGGFTTFSAVALESQVFIQNGEFIKMLAYVGLQTLLGILLCLIGYNLLKH